MRVGHAVVALPLDLPRTAVLHPVSLHPHVQRVEASIGNSARARDRAEARHDRARLLPGSRFVAISTPKRGLGYIRSILV
eukprot:scaffold12317_cov115-Isochrysis_galbana.AAC.3